MNKIIVFACALAVCGAVKADEMTAVVSNLMEKAAAAGWTPEGMMRGLDRLDRWYQANVGDEKFRRQLNGEIVNIETDTNALTRTYTYTNGTVYVRHYESVRAMGLKERLDAAAKRQRIEDERKARKEAAERRRLDRIAALETNLVVETSRLMAQKDWPEELARLYLLNELSKLKGTNVVNATITPQGAR